jgi:hypothetical protein
MCLVLSKIVLKRWFQHASAKNGSFAFAEVSALCVGAKANVPFVRLAKIELKKCAVGKIKNTKGSAMSVGLLVVPLKYGLYVGHLSKWFVFVSSFMVALSSFRLAYNGVGLCEVADLHQKC